ncbi:hypothetical protein HPP92_019974 [Vanilla planifolia]|uniref:Uncharacterized protein n=1 Tax=Vanilla planifolia TaxID=51239 RepID=A0A835Q7S3_VANPL|nr:hypothetical protein HPP92_020406 [Vanilla planifolia]KAG0465810.1 hypothetical protein HPP92_019974 [Vanilla planifolia]
MAPKGFYHRSTGPASGPRPLTCHAARCQGPTGSHQSKKRPLYVSLQSSRE